MFVSKCLHMCFSSVVDWIKHPLLVSQGRFEGLWSFQCLGPGPSSAGVQAESQWNPQRVGFLWHFSRFSWDKCGKLVGNDWQTWKTCRNNLKRNGEILRNYEKKLWTYVVFLGLFLDLFWIHGTICWRSSVPLWFAMLYLLVVYHMMRLFI